MRPKNSFLVLHELLVILRVEADDVFVIKYDPVGKRELFHGFIELLQDVMEHIMWSYGR